MTRHLILAGTRKGAWTISGNSTLVRSTNRGQGPLPDSMGGGFTAA